MKLFALPAAFGLIFSLTAVTPAQDEKKDDDQSEGIERSMPVDPHATITVCVQSGTINVRAWDKHEVRVRSNDAEVLEFRRIDKQYKEKDKQKQTPAPLPPATRVDVMVMDSSDKTGAKGDCQAVADVELEVPPGATVQAQTRDGDILIAGVSAAYAGSQNGNIAIERASKLVEAGSVGGDIELRDSSGRVNLSSAGGAVLVSNVKPASPDDTFEVGTVSGDIQLDHVTNSNLVAKTVNGTVTMVGALARSGQYGFTTLSGDVILHLPSDASFKITAKLSDNREIESDFSLKFQESPPPPPPTPSPTTPSATAPRTPGMKSPAPTVKGAPPSGVVVKRSAMPVAYMLRRVTAICGSGDATISVASFSGTVHLKKL